MSTNPARRRLAETGVQMKDEAEGEASDRAGAKDTMIDSTSTWTRPAPLKLSSIRQAPGPVTVSARMEHWAHEDEDAFHYPLQTPQIKNVRMVEEKGYLHAPPSSPAVQLVREVQEQAWHHHPPASQAVTGVRKVQEALYKGQADRAQVSTLRSVEEDFFPGINDLASLAVKASMKKLSAGSTSSHAPLASPPSPPPPDACLTKTELDGGRVGGGEGEVGGAGKGEGEEGAHLGHSLSFHTLQGAKIWKGSAFLREFEMEEGSGCHGEENGVIGRSPEEEEQARHSSLQEAEARGREESSSSYPFSSTLSSSNHPTAPSPPLMRGSASMGCSGKSAPLSHPPSKHPLPNTTTTSLSRYPHHHTPLTATSSLLSVKTLTGGGGSAAVDGSAVAALLQQAALIAALRSHEDKGWIHPPPHSPAIAAIREDQEERFFKPLLSPQVLAVRKAMASFRSVPVSPASAGVRQRVEELRKPPMSPQLEAFRQAMDDPFAGYIPPVAPSFHSSASNSPHSRPIATK